MPKTEKIRSMFDSIAGDYDRLNHLMSLGVDRRWRRVALRYLVPPGGRPGRSDLRREREGPDCAAERERRYERGPTALGGAASPDAQERPAILDIACGTGDFAIAAARAFPQAQVTGMDLSEGMLSVMEGKVARAGLDGRISTLQGDCTRMHFDNGAFDCATIAFGIRNFEDRPAALREILRVLRPGGRLVILELSVSSNKALRRLYKLYFCHLMPWIGGLISGDRAAYRYLPASVLAFPGPGEWMQVMRDAGFTDVVHRALSLGLCRLYVGVKP